MYSKSKPGWLDVIKINLYNSTYRYRCIDITADCQFNISFLGEMNQSESSNMYYTTITSKQICCLSLAYLKAISPCHLGTRRQGLTTLDSHSSLGIRAYTK